MDLPYVLSGLLVGFVVGLTGVGGGSLMTPMLVLLFSVKPAVAIGTDLLYAALTKSVGILVHGKRGTVCWRTVALLASGSIPASILAVLLLEKLEMRGANYDRIMTSVLSAALILTALVLLFRGKLTTLARKTRALQGLTECPGLVTPMTVAAGTLIGALVTFSSVGAGAIGAAMLFFLYPRMRPSTVVGTDLAHAVPVTAIAGLGHVHLGTVDFSMLANLLLGSLPGIYLGSHAGFRLRDEVLRPILACMLLLIGIRMAIQL